MTTTFFLVRHAVTTHTGSRLSGWTPGVHLSEDGRTQAERVAEHLANVPLKAVYASPLERALETARPIAARHGLDIRRTRGLGEVEYGKWTNRSFKVLTRTKLWSTIMRLPSAAQFPDGESLRDVQERALDEVESIRRAHPKQAVCCVSHGDVIKLIAAHYLGIHMDLFQRIVVLPGSISVIALGDGEPRVVTLGAAPFSGMPR